jgi:hypothetical protein
MDSALPGWLAPSEPYTCECQTIYLDERVKNIVHALQIIIREPTANTVPGKKSAVALNNEPNDTGPVSKVNQLMLKPQNTSSE